MNFNDVDGQMGNRNNQEAEPKRMGRNQKPREKPNDKRMEVEKWAFEFQSRFLPAEVVRLQVEIANDVCDDEAYKKISIHCSRNLNVQSNSGLPLCSTIWRRWRARSHSIV